MNIRSVMANAGSLLVTTLADDETVTILHKDTGETITRSGFYKSKLAVKDPYGAQTEYQDVPRFRVADVPPEWDEDSMQGDELTDSKGDRWKVARAQLSPAGGATLYVTQIGRAA